MWVGVLGRVKRGAAPHMTLSRVVTSDSQPGQSVGLVIPERGTCRRPIKVTLQFTFVSPAHVFFVEREVEDKG